MHKYILFGLFIASSAVGVATEDVRFNDPTASSFASDVASSGDFALVGAAYDGTGSVYSYQKIGGVWVLDEQFFAPDGEDGDSFGDSVAMSGEVAIIGASSDDDATSGDNSGSAYLFRHDGSDWVFEQKITASDASSDARFGGVVAISGTVAVVGFRNLTGAPGGAAYVFRYNGATWVEEKILTASDAVAGDEFGAAVAVFDDVVVVGAAEKSGGGAAYIFRNTTGTTWVEEKILTASDGVEDDEFGDGVDVSGSLAIIGATSEGAAYIYRNTGGTTWVETKITRENPNGGTGGFGGAVAISGEVALVGAAQAESNKGTGHLFRFDGSEWGEAVLVQSNRGDFGDPSSNFWFGDSVALSGDYAMLGAAFDNGFGGNGAAFIYNLAPEITWSVPADIEFGTALSSTQLNATSDVPGTFIYSPSSGTVLDAGDHTLTVNFTPTDTARYASASATVSITILGVDDYLPGDYATTFGDALVDVPVSGIIEIDGDRDRFEVTLQAGIVYDISLEGIVTGGGSLIDPEIIGVFNSLGQLVLGSADNNSGAGANALVSGLTVGADGIYQIEVGSAQDLGFGDYTLTVESRGYLDDYLPGISVAFGSVSIGGQTTGEIETSGDVDSFVVSLQANTTYRISILGLESNNGTLPDPDLFGVFSANDLLTAISSVQTLDADFVVDDSISYFTPQNAGEYYISVQDSEGGIGTYTVAVGDIGVTDDHSADVDTTGSIAVGGSGVGRIEFAGDSDWYEVSLAANRLYEIELVSATGADALADPVFLGVYDSNGVLIPNTDNKYGVYTTYSALKFATDDAGTFYLAAGGFNEETGQYRLELNDQGVLDNDRFDITIEYTSVYTSDQDVPQEYISAFEDAVERWEEIITGDLSFGFVEGYGSVDDVLIEVAVEDLSLVFGVDKNIEARSTVLDLRSDTFAGAGALPTYSRIFINTHKIGEILNLDEFAMHTIGRALGFGSLWKEFDIVRDIDGVATYTGPNALREMEEIWGGPGVEQRYMLEDGADGALAAEYWSGEFLGYELMTSRFKYREPWDDPAPFGIPDNPISALTIGAMEDLGYQVDYGAADDFGGQAPPEISVEYNGLNIEDGESRTSTYEGTDFGDQDYISASETRTFRVSNTGVSILRLGAASSSSAEFSVSGLASSISGGSFDDFTVTFDPSSAGTKIATISFSTNDSDENPFNFTVIGVGTEPTATTWYSGASQIQPAGWLYYDWFKGFKPEGPNWIYHGRHGWLYTLADDTNRMFLWDGALGRWMYTNATTYPWMYAYGADGGWVFFFQGGRPGGRFFKRGDNGQTVSEQNLSLNP